MTNSWGWLRKRFLGLSPEEASFTQRGFRGGEVSAQLHLERIGHTFLVGYHIALEEDKLHSLALRLNTIEAEFQGFAFEGAAMALALLDRITPWQKNRLIAFLNGPGVRHIYMIFVGAGWALARVPLNIGWHLTRLDPLLGWLAIDGFGFHEGYFHWPRYVIDRSLPKRLSGYALHAFDQGLGRSLWFVDGADIERIHMTISAFPRSRHADLWSGIGLACAYAGGVDDPSIGALCQAAQDYHPHLAQGAVFAAKARERAGNPAPHTERACQILCGMSAEKAALVADIAMANLPADSAEPAYEVWRRRIRSHFA